MKKALVFLLGITHLIDCRSQNKPLEQLQYFAAAPNKCIMEILIKGDSLIMVKRRGNVEVNHSSFFIEKKIAKGNLTYCYTRRKSIAHNENVNPVTLFVMKQTEDKSRLFILHEDKEPFPTVASCEAAAKNLNVDLKYFYTYYDEKEFKRQQLLPSVKVGDTTSVMKIVDVMKENLTVNQYKILNTHVIDPYGFGIVRDLLNISLVETGFCPNIEIQEFQSRLASVGAQFPAIGNINNKRAKRANYKKGLVAPKVE